MEVSWRDVSFRMEQWGYNPKSKSDCETFKKELKALLLKIQQGLAGCTLNSLRSYAAAITKIVTIKTLTSMNKISAKELRVVRITARMLVFVNKDGQEFFASKRVANEILSGSVDEVFFTSQNFFNKQGVRHSMLILATPSCW